jgi:hypothetical protein
MKILWVDLLCFYTIFIACFKNSRDFDRIHYINVQRNFRPFINIISKLINRPIICIDYIIETEEFLNNSNLYDIKQERAWTILDEWVSTPNTKKRISSFVNQTGFNKAKYTEYLRQKAYHYALKPVEIYTFSKIIGEDSINKFLLKKTPLNQEIKYLFAPQPVNFYSYSSNFIEERKNYYYDRPAINNYYRSNFYQCLRLAIEWFSSSFSSLFSNTKNNKFTVLGNANIGVELIQVKVKPNFISDTYWLNNSNIDLKSVMGLTTLDYDSESLSNINKLGFKVFNVTGSIFKSINNRIVQRKINYRPKYIFADKKYFKSTFIKALQIFKSVYLSTNSSWFNLQESHYYIRVEFWKSIYSQFNIQMLWSMYDIDSEKLIKAQAIESCKGLFLGSHWSNHSRINVETNKCYDIFFVWSKYFTENIFSRFDYKATFQTGYPSDYYFEDAKIESNLLKDVDKNNFVLSYFDNTVRNDLPNSENSQFQIYELLINLLINNHKLIVLLKPKRKAEFANELAKLKALKDFIDIGRIKVYYGDSERSKVRPAELAFVSDLVIGIGVSSAAAEACFAGSVSFYVNLSKMKSYFEKSLVNKVVFKDINSLKKAIIKQINDKGISIEECQNYHKLLDPYQDGLAFIRTGLILSHIQEELTMCNEPDKAILSARNKFSELSC